MAVFIR